MKKKLICLLLAAVMTVGMLAGCSGTNENNSDSTDTDTTKRTSMTLSLWIPTDENTTDDAIMLVQEALTKLTSARYDTAIELHAIPRSEYQETIDSRLEEIAEMRRIQQEAEESREKEIRDAKAKVIKITEAPASDVETEPLETIIDKYDRVVKQYPKVNEDQLDIFLVQGLDNYLKYIEEEKLMGLGGELNGTSKMLKSYIYPTYLSLVDEFGVYAIPNNHPVGEYKYFLVNKELVDKYDYNAQNLKGYMQCKDFIKDIGSQNLEGVIPLLDEIDPGYLCFWGTDSSEWSMISSLIANGMKYSSNCAPEITLLNNAYTNMISLNKELSELGYVGDGNLKEGEKFAVGVISGDVQTAEEYADEYYVYNYASPMFTEEDIFGSMFAVSAYTNSLARSMEIITYINTDKTIRTILQYGVQGVHWDYENELTEDTIMIISDDYSMNLLETGNVYMTYPGEGISMDYWEYGKKQNLDSISSPFIKFSTPITEENIELVKQLDEISKEYKARIDAMSFEEFTESLDEMKSELLSNEVLRTLLDSENKSSFTYLYADWRAYQYPGE